MGTRDRAQCEVGGCGGDARKDGVYQTGERGWRLCEPHYAVAARAVGEVVAHLVETGETYLPGTATTVLVEYVIQDTDEAETAFRDFGASPDLRPGNPPGFIGETLYRVLWDGESNDGVRRFVNIGQWTERSPFEAKFRSNDATRPAKDDTFEFERRRRGWLTRDR